MHGALRLKKADGRAMYKNFFELHESPFTIAPDPRYLYMSEQHREALAHLLYGCKYEGGFVLLTGEVGTGKTTVCRCLLEQIPADTDVALILNPRQTVPELLASICQEFSIEVPPTDSVKVLVDAINHFLLGCNQNGRKAVLVIDEAQALSCEVLDQIRLLTNLETNTRKLLQIIMLGQPELLEKLARPEMRQLAQRITARYHLGPLSKQEVKEYVQHRWKVAGGRGDLLNDRQISRLYMLSKGIPRVINVICERILLGAYSQDVRKISMAMFRQAAKEVLGEVGSRRRIARKEISGLLWGALAAAVIFLIFTLSWRFVAENNSPAKSFRSSAAVPAVSSPNPKPPSATTSSAGTTTDLTTQSTDSASAPPSDENSLAIAGVNPLVTETTGEASSASHAPAIPMDWLLKGHSGQLR
ncbi:MAG: AAA family ATPase, partial [Deltaproteobacteria bacterium]